MIDVKQGYTERSDASGDLLVKRSEDFYQMHEPFISPLWSEMQIDIRFVAGDQQLMNVLYDPKSQVNNPFVINLMQRYIGMVTGFQRNHRKSLMMVPFHEDTDQMCDDYNGCFKWNEERSNFQELFSENFESSSTVGEALMHAYPDYGLDPSSPDIQWSSLSAMWYMRDSNSRRRDMLDCEGIFTRQWVSKKKALKLLPGRDKEIMNVPVGWGQDGKFPIQQALLANKIEALIPYDEFHYLSTRRAQVIYDPQSKQYIEWEDEKDADERELKHIKEVMPWLVFKKMEIPTVKLGILIAGKPYYDGPNLLGIDRYPFALNQCNAYPDSPTPRMRVQGFGRLMRSLQFLYTLRKMAELSILQSQANTGWIYPVDAVTDPKAFRQTADGIVIPLKKGHSPEEIKRIEPPIINPAIIELSRLLKDDFAAVTGINDEMIGATVQDQSGILEMFRQAAGLVTLRKIFDGADFCLRQCGEILRDGFRKNFTRAKVRSILNRDPDPRFFSNIANRYGLAVEEGAYSTTQRQMELQQYLHFKQLGMNVADKTIWRAAFLTNKKRAMQEAEEVSKGQQQQQMQQAKSEAESAEADNMKKISSAQLDIAKSEETLAKIGL
jgi:hypothetical protein